MPVFWGRAIANFAYTLAATGLLLALAAAVSELRQARSECFDNETTAVRYDQARLSVTSLGAMLAALPIIVALA